MKKELIINLDQFEPRDYQIPLMEALWSGEYKKFLLIMPRGSGKDVIAFNFALQFLLENVCVAYYVFPTYSQARKAIFDSITNDGKRFLDFIPKPLISNINQMEMKIKLVNSSILQFIGSKKIDNLMGTNPKLCIFSEYALQDPTAYALLRPRLIGNEGTVIFLSTPRGHNHLHELYNNTVDNDTWYTKLLTLNDTKHLSLEQIKQDVQDGVMSPDMVQQEYFCDFNIGIAGSFYGRYIDEMRLDDRITQLSWDPAYPVNTAWDLGVRVDNTTAIIFFQIIGTTIKIIDCAEGYGFGLEHYVSILNSKPYKYGSHVFPHDAKVFELGMGSTRVEKLIQLGIEPRIAPKKFIADGIEVVRSTLSKVFIDSKKCAPLIKALENYRQEYDPLKRRYKPNAVHDWASNFSDSMRYLCVTYPELLNHNSAEALDKRYRSVMYGEDDLGPIFGNKKFELSNRIV